MTPIWLYASARGGKVNFVPTPDEIEASLNVPGDVADALIAVRDAQDAQRGQWPSPREQPQPQPLWPAEDSPVLRYLLREAEASLDAGMDVETALVQLAVHAWFEGGIENYDRGRRDAQAAGVSGPRLRSI